MRESSVDLTQFLRQHRAKKLQNFRKSGAPRAQKFRAPGRHALRILHNVSEMERVSSACRSEKAHVEITHIVRQNRAKEIAKFPKNFGAPRAQKLRALSMRSEKSKVPRGNKSPSFGRLKIQRTRSKFVAKFLRFL